MKNRIDIQETFVIENYSYDRYHDKNKTIYVAITDFLAYSKPVLEEYIFNNKVYIRIGNAAIPKDLVGYVSCVVKYKTKDIHNDT